MKLVQNMCEIQARKEESVVEGTENVNKIEVNEVNKGSEEIGVNMK